MNNLLKITRECDLKICEGLIVDIPTHNLKNVIINRIDKDAAENYYAIVRILMTDGEFNHFWASTFLECAKINNKSLIELGYHF